MTDKVLGFEVIDRRGKGKERRDEPVAAVENMSKDVSRKEWKDVGYMVIMLQTPGGMMVSGRAIGLRGDGRTFAADWILPPIWAEGMDWTKTARKRLDTFLGCDCGAGGLCSAHRIYREQWPKSDADRLNLLSTQPLAPAIEAMMKSEQAKQQNRIITPER